MAGHGDPGPKSAVGPRTVIQHRVEAGVDQIFADVVARRRALHDEELDGQALTAVFAAFVKNQPRLSEDEVARIADQAAQRVIDRFERRVRPTKLKAVRRTVRDIARGVVAGLLTPGAAALITYIAHAAGLAAAETDTTSGQRERYAAKRRDFEVQRRLLESLPMRTIRAFERDDEVIDELRRDLITLLREVVQPDLTKDILLQDDEIPPPYFGHPVVSDFLDQLWSALSRDLGAHVEASNPQVP